MLTLREAAQLYRVPTDEQEPTAPRRWSAFVCPECRLIFRLPRDHDGKGIVCPHCRLMLRIPVGGDESAPLITPLQQIGFSDDETHDPRGEKRTRATRKKKDKEAELPDWEASAGRWRLSRKKGKRALRSLALWTLTIAAITGVIFFLYKDNGGRGFWERKALRKEITASPRMLHDEELEEPVDLPKIMRLSQTEFLSLAQPIAETFLAATSFDQILPLVRNGEEMRSKIFDHYPNGKIKATVFTKFNATGQVSYKDSFAAVTILTADFERRQLAFVDGKDGLKIDWESWVGWSEMPWDKLLESRPDQPIMIRTMLRAVDYYNFGFTDDSKWRSYLLTSPDGAHTLYGYIERNSLLDQRLRPGEQNTSLAVTLKIRFPEDGEGRNQALIDEYVADGWVIPEKSE